MALKNGEECSPLPEDGILLVRLPLRCVVEGDRDKEGDWWFWGLRLERLLTEVDKETKPLKVWLGKKVVQT